MRLKELRLEKGLYQKEVASILGVDRTTYSKYESGTSEPNFEMLLKISQLFNVTTDYLLGQTNEREEKQPTPVTEDGLSEEQLEVIRRFEAAPPALRAAALAVLRSAEEQDKVQGDGSAGK